MIGDGFPALLRAAQAGDEAAFSVLWRDSNPGLLRYLAVLAQAEPEDVASETWLQVVRGLKKFRGGEAAWRAWLFTTARRRAIDAGRRRRRRPSVSLEQAPAIAFPRSPDSAELVLESFGTRAALEAIAALPPLQAEVVMLRVVGGLSTEDVGRLLGRSPGAVRVAAHRGLRRLADVMTTAGVTL